MQRGESSIHLTQNFQHYFERKLTIAIQYLFKEIIRVKYTLQKKRLMFILKNQTAQF